MKESSMSAAECERLTKELEKIEKEFANDQRQLGNEQFLAKAPANVVEGLRTRAQELALMQEKTKSKLKGLNGVVNLAPDNWPLTTALWTGIADALPPSSRTRCSKTGPRAMPPATPAWTQTSAPRQRFSPSRIAFWPASAAWRASSTCMPPSTAP